MHKEENDERHWDCNLGMNESLESKGLSLEPFEVDTLYQGNIDCTILFQGLDNRLGTHKFE